MLRNRKSNIVVSNIIFLVLNIVFFSAMIVFVAMQSSGKLDIEQITAKKIALMIDAARPISIISVDLKEVFDIARENSVDEPIFLEGNNVVVKLSQKSGASYSFFNDVNVELNLPQEDTDQLVIVVR